MSIFSTVGSGTLAANTFSAVEVLDEVLGHAGERDHVVLRVVGLVGADGLLGPPRLAVPVGKDHEGLPLSLGLEAHGGPRLVDLAPVHALYALGRRPRQLGGEGGVSGGLGRGLLGVGQALLGRGLIGFLGGCLLRVGLLAGSGRRLLRVGVFLLKSQKRWRRGRRPRPGPPRRPYRPGAPPPDKKTSSRRAAGAVLVRQLLAAGEQAQGVLVRVSPTGGVRGVCPPRDPRGRGLVVRRVLRDGRVVAVVVRVEEAVTDNLAVLGHLLVGGPLDAP